LAFIDDSGFLSQPLRRRVWAECGQTPVQHAWDRHNRITAMAALCRAPGARRLSLYYELLDHNVRSADIVQFLRLVHDRCSLYATASRPIAPLFANCSLAAAIGSAPNGCRDTRPNSIPSKAFETNRSMVTWPTGFPATFTNCTTSSAALSANTDMTSFACTPYFSAAQLPI
jgi:hypothetical protein